MLDRQKCKQFALQQLKNRWTTPVLMTLLIAIVGAILSFSTEFINISNVENINVYDEISQLTPFIFIFSIIEVLVTVIFEVASINLYLKMSRSPENITMKPFFEGFNMLGRAILAGLWIFLWIYLWALILVIGFGLIVFAVTFFASELYFVVGFIYIVTFIALMWSLFYIYYRYSQYFFIITEFPNLPIRKALNLSKTITKNHLWELFILELSFFGWIILALFSLGIGLLWVEPYMQMTKINFYHGLLKEAIDKGIVKTEELAKKTSENNNQDVNMKNFEEEKQISNPTEEINSDNISDNISDNNSENNTNI